MIVIPEEKECSIDEINSTKLNVIWNGIEFELSGCLGIVEDLPPDFFDDDDASEGFFEDGNGRDDRRLELECESSAELLVGSQYDTGIHSYSSIEEWKDESLIDMELPPDDESCATTEEEGSNDDQSLVNITAEVINDDDRVEFVEDECIPITFQVKQNETHEETSSKKSSLLLDERKSFATTDEFLNSSESNNDEIDKTVTFPDTMGMKNVAEKTVIQKYLCDMCFSFYLTLLVKRNECKEFENYHV